ncbi:MAG: hypothetical protein BEN18_02035 [Epulopiscium sp. Nuni2H_MBin001]|nr:MAG: hypothetical protein BEN18_02035 [Epulopiscium sp. Nuni2H_MBin001]
MKNELILLSDEQLTFHTNRYEQLKVQWEQISWAFATEVADVIRDDLNIAIDKFEQSTTTIIRDKLCIEKVLLSGNDSEKVLQDMLGDIAISLVQQWSEVNYNFCADLQCHLDCILWGPMEFYNANFPKQSFDTDNMLMSISRNSFDDVIDQLEEANFIRWLSSSHIAKTQFWKTMDAVSNVSEDASKFQLINLQMQLLKLIATLKHQVIRFINAGFKDIRQIIEHADIEAKVYTNLLELA